jgi:hypothetical protein
VLFTATIANGGANPIYQWKKNGVDTVSNSSTITINNQGETITCQLTSNAACAMPNQLTSNGLSVPVNVASIETIISRSVCYGGLGRIDINVATGTAPPMQYRIDGGAYQSNITYNLLAGLHTVTVRDNDGCLFPLADHSIGQPTQIVASVSAGNIAQAGGTTILTVTASGGSGTLNYQLNGSAYQTSHEFTVGAGNYIVTVKDGQGCTLVLASFNVSEPPPIVASAAAGAILCHNGTATLTVTASGGVAPLKYSLDGVTYQSSNLFTVSGGNYIITVRDANLITVQTASINVANPTFVAASASTGTILCTNGTTTLTVTASGGTGVYTYSLNGGTPQNGNSFTVSAGNQVVTVKDANDCTVQTASLNVANPTFVAASASAGTILCTNGTTILTVLASGGTGAYSYRLNNSGTYQIDNQFVVRAGTHIVTVKDVHDCTITTTPITVLEPTPLSATASAGAILCYNGNTNLTIAASGGTGAYAYRLNNEAYQMGNIFVVNAGTHIVTVKDANPCTVETDSITVAQPSALTATAPTNLILCNNGTTQLTVSASGGTGAYQYALNGGIYQVGNSFVVGAGNYRVTVRDTHNCAFTTPSIVVSQPTRLTASASAGTILCKNGMTHLTVLANGGTGAYQYRLNGGTPQNSNVFTVSAGNQLVTVRDANGCNVETIAITVFEPSAIIASNSAGIINCHAGTTQLVVTANGGTGAYTYRLNQGAFQIGTLFTVGAGTHAVTVKDANDCTFTTIPITVLEPTALTARDSVGTILCHGGTTDLTITANGGTGIYQYRLNNGTFQNDNNFIISAGNQSVTIKDANQCSIHLNPIQITQPDTLVVSLQADTMICPGSTTVLTVSITGGTLPYAYQMNQAPLRQSDTMIVRDGMYRALAQDANLCKVESKAFQVREARALVGSLMSSALDCHPNSELLCYPNPFVNELSIEFNLSEPSDVVIELLNVLNQPVKTLEQGILPSGHYVSRWDLIPLAENAYFVTLKLNGVRSKWQKVVRVRR